MKRTLLSTILLTSSVFASNLFIEDAKRFKSYAVIVAVDVSGFNNQNSCPSLALKNKEMIEMSFSKKNIRRMRLMKTEILTFHETINNIEIINEKRPSKLFRRIMNAMESVDFELKKDFNGKSKDVISSLRYLASLASENYQVYDEVAILFVSNLRDSSHTKEYFKTMKPIIFPNNVSLHILGKSGLECVKEASASQILEAETRTKAFFYKVIQASKVNIKTMY